MTVKNKDAENYYSYFFTGIFVIPLLLFANIIVGFVAVLLGMDLATENLVILQSITLLAEFLTIFFILYLTKNLRNWKNTLGFKNFSVKNVLKGSLFGFLLFFGLQSIAFIINIFSGEQIGSSETSESFSSSTGLTLVFALITVPFIVPLVEEIVFRSGIFGLLNTFFQNTESNIFSKQNYRKYGTVFAVIFSSVCFSLLHIQITDNWLMDVFVPVWIFIVGVVNSLLYLKTDSVYTPYFSHMTYNFLSFIIPLILL